ncbi:MAG TPA: hypothetical protein VIZ28_03280 [Chitinophagaceae bacterium]
MTKKRIILAAVAIAVISGGWYGYKEYTRKVKDLSKVKAQVQMRATDLITSFEKSEKEANVLYLDKVIAVTGKIKTVENDGKGSYSVVLGEENSMSSVRCSMDTTYQQDVASLPAGIVITIKGVCTGFNTDELLGSDVILNRCVVEK